MKMAKDFKLFHTLFLVFSWNYCVKVGATFDDITGIIGLSLDHPFRHTFGSAGVPMLSNAGDSSTSNVVEIQSPAQAPTSEIAPVGLETDPIKNTPSIDILDCNDHEFYWNIGRDIALSNGGIISRKMKGDVLSSDGKINLKSNGNIVVSRGLQTSMSRNNKALFFGVETEKHNAASLGLKAPERKVHVGVSDHGGKISLTKRGSMVSNGRRIGLKSKGNVVVSHGFGIEGTM